MIHSIKRNQPVLCPKSGVTNFSKLFIAILLFVSSSSFAQTITTEVEIFQKVVGLEKKAAVVNLMKLGDSNQNFWAIYDEYEAERQNIGKERIAIILEYAKNYPDISEEKILELYKRTQSVKKSFEKLQATYFNKMKKEIGTSKAAQFWQLENYFNALIQAEIYSQIPFIGANQNKQ